MKLNTLSGISTITKLKDHNKINDQLLSNCDNLINIPMFGNVDSLNLSVSTGIILYEAINQRKFS